MSKPNIKMEKITLWTCIDTYGQDHVAGMTSLDEIIPVLETVDVNVLHYDSEELELKPTTH